MGSVDLTHVSGASSTQEVPYARFYLVVIYSAGYRDATTLNNAENRVIYAYTHHRVIFAIPQSGRSWSVGDRPISMDGFAASTIKFKARQLVPYAGTTTIRLMSSRPDATEIDTGFHVSVAINEELSIWLSDISKELRELVNTGMYRVPPRINPAGAILWSALAAKRKTKRRESSDRETRGERQRIDENRTTAGMYTACPSRTSWINTLGEFHASLKATRQTLFRDAVHFRRMSRALESI
ncbi:hypothetical protein ALC53_08055 [Atta colombica]|uniref:Uncharacterized protein n=1 Tax=Atta colombica TaxID=520822 RepID=A0A151I2V4_9HYME|nr:hypothetical protein ALC53_08055 [Atta colombica]